MLQKPFIHVSRRFMPVCTSLLCAVILTACAAGGGQGFYSANSVADFPTSLGQASVLPLAGDQLEVRIPRNGGFIIDGRDVVDVQVFPMTPVADGEVVLIGTSYPGCARDYYAITYGAWEPDFYRLGNCERPMEVRFEPATNGSQAVVIQDQTGALRYGVDRRTMVRLEAAVISQPPVPQARPSTPNTTPSRNRPAARQTAPATDIPAARDFKLPPVGTLSVE